MTTTDLPHSQERATRPAVATAGLVLLVVAVSLLNAGRGVEAAVSLLIGAALGFTFQRGRFCFYCIFRDFIKRRDASGLYAILTALAVGGIGYALVFGMFLPDPGGGRLPPQAHIGPTSIALVAAGLAFGVGMALSGACISGHLYRIGEGYTRAVPALFGALVGFGIGFSTWNGLWSATIATADALWLPAAIGYGGALLVHLTVIGAIAVALLRYLPERPARPAGRLDLAAIVDAVLRRRWNPLVTGSLVGAVGVLAYLRVEPLGVTAQLGSVTRTVLAGRDLLPERLNGLDTLAGCATIVMETIMNNGWLVIGFVFAALVGGVASGRFSPTRPTLTGTATAFAGGVAMGWGAMTALGCTVGVFLSVISAFAVSGWVFAAATFAGVWFGIRVGFDRG